MRLFVALPIPFTVAEELRFLSGGIPQMRWIPMENYHLTLRFLGETDGAALADLDAALAGIHAPGFSLQCQGVGCFSSGPRIKTLWAGLQKSPALLHLRDKVESACVRAGFPPSGKKFTPHITLAYAKNPVPMDKLQAYLAHHNLFRSQHFDVSHFILYSSWTGGEHSIYRSERIYELAISQEVLHD